MNEVKKTYLVRKIEDKKTRKVMSKGDKSQIETHKLEAIGQDGGNRITLISPEPFDGVSENEVIDIVIKKSQTSLNDFGAWKEKEPKKDVAK